jgi:hypothetical protein
MEIRVNNCALNFAGNGSRYYHVAWGPRSGLIFQLMFHHIQLVVKSFLVYITLYRFNDCVMA